MKKENIIDIITDEDGRKIVVITDIRFKGKRNIDWEDVENYLKEYVGKCYEVVETADQVFIGNDFPESRFSHMIMPLPGNVRDVGQIGEYIEIMLEAMYLHKKIQFQYTEINNAMEKVLRKEGKMYQLNLYTIYWSDNNYYLIGSHDNHDGLTNYRLDRIENMSMSSEETIPAEEKIGVNPELVIQDYIKKSVNHFSGDTIRIEVEYKPAPITNAILYDFAGEGIRVRPLDNGKYKAVFKKMDSVTLVGWFVQYANRFKVISPKSLKDKIIENLEQAQSIYSE